MAYTFYLNLLFSPFFHDCFAATKLLNPISHSLSASILLTHTPTHSDPISCIPEGVSCGIGHIMWISVWPTYAIPVCMCHNGTDTQPWPSCLMLLQKEEPMSAPEDLPFACLFICVVRGGVCVLRVFLFVCLFVVLSCFILSERLKEKFIYDHGRPVMQMQLEGLCSKPLNRCSKPWSFDVHLLFLWEEKTKTWGC